MDDVQFDLDEKGNGTFYINKDDQKIAEMVIDISKGDLSVYHTEVMPEFEGEGFAKELLNNMVNYARSHDLKVIAFCPFVHSQFARHPEEYEDIWKNKKNKHA